MMNKLFFEMPHLEQELKDEEHAQFMEGAKEEFEKKYGKAPDEDELFEFIMEG